MNSYILQNNRFSQKSLNDVGFDLENLSSIYDFDAIVFSL